MKIIDAIDNLTMINLKALTDAFFERNPVDWRYNAEILLNWIPQRDEPTWACYGEEHNIPKVVVRYMMAEKPVFLRHSKGPRQGFGWDSYPDDMQSWCLAFKALVEAPTPYGLWVPTNGNLNPESTDQFLAQKARAMKWRSVL